MPINKKNQKLGYAYEREHVAFVFLSLDISLSIITSAFIYFLPNFISSFKWQNKIPLYIATIFSLSILLLMDIWPDISPLLL